VRNAWVMSAAHHGSTEGATGQAILITTTHEEEGPLPRLSDRFDLA
jgi:hypothetical protein